MAKDDLKRIIANIAWMIFDKVFLLILNLFVVVKVANYFGASEYGNYEYAASVIAILEILVTFVDGRVVKKYYDSADAQNLVYNATICRVLFSVVSAIIGIGLVVWDYRGIEYTMMFSMLLINAILTNLRFGMANRFEYLLKSKKIVVAKDISALISAVLQLVAISLNASIVTIAVIMAVSSLVNLVIIAVQYKAEFCDGGKCFVDKPLIKKLIKESLPLAVAASCATVYMKCDSVMLGNMLSSVEVGIYAISTKLIMVVQIAIAPIRESVYPKLISLYSTNKKEYECRYIQITSILTWIYIVGVLMSFAVLPFFFRFMDSDYALAFPVYKIHVIGAFFTYNAALRAGHYTLINRGSILTYSQVASVLVNIVLNVIGIKYLGIYGAALTTVITQGISLMVSNLFFGKTGREVFVWQVKALNPMRIFKKVT